MSRRRTSVKLPLSYLEGVLGGNTDFKILKELRGTGSLTQSELVDQVGRSKSTVSESLNRLEQHGIVNRSTPEGDRERPQYFSLVSQEMFQ